MKEIKRTKRELRANKFLLLSSPFFFSIIEFQWIAVTTHTTQHSFDPAIYLFIYIDTKTTTLPNCLLACQDLQVHLQQQQQQQKQQLTNFEFRWTIQPARLRLRRGDWRGLLSWVMFDLIIHLFVSLSNLSQWMDGQLIWMKHQEESN